MTAHGKRSRIGDVLVNDGALSEEQLTDALTEQKKTGRLLGQILVDDGVISSRVLVHALARSLGVRGCQLRHGLIDPALLKIIGEEEAQRL